MTYILGANCNDGIVLVADRKVTFKENRSTVDYRKKLFGYPSHLYYPIVVGCAGSTVISDQFEDDMLTIAMEYHGKITLDKFIPQLTSKIKEYFKTTYKDQFKPEEFEIVLAIQTDNGAILKHILGEGLPIKIASHRYVVLGSESGMMRTRTLFQPLWSHGLDMIKVGEFGYFFIRYVERYHLDDLIGTERDTKPQIWYIPNQGHLSEAKEPYLNNLEIKTQERLVRNENNFKDLFACPCN
jgi:hypothetical protein